MMMENKSKKLNNKGISIVEVLVVVAIMSIVAGAVSVGFSIISHSYTRKALSGISDALGTCRTKAMSVVADEWNMTIEAGSEGEYVVKINKIVGTETTVISEATYGGIASIDFFNITNDVEKKAVIGSGDEKLTIVFSKEQGSISQVLIGNNPIDIELGEALGDLGRIDITGDDDYKRRIELYYTTGKYETLAD